MKFLTYRYDQVVRTGILSTDEKRIISIDTVFPDRGIMTMQKLIASLTETDIVCLSKAADCGQSEGINVESAEILAPIPEPLHDIICVGVNYKDHLEETQESFQKDFKTPEQAVYFSKRAIRILGSQEVIPARPDLDEEIDYEAELAVIIGKEGTSIPIDQAEDYIFGYSIFNDLSSRRLQRDHVQWFRGKSLDGYSAMGPVILHKSALPLPTAVPIRSKVNGELRQSSNTSLFINGIAKIIAELSDGMTLMPGDIIITGTPAGVGMGFQPPKYLKSGDVVACEIPPIGTLTNRIR